MSSATEELLNAALSLCDEDRLELTEALATSLQPIDRPPFDESWLEVIRRRSAELREGKVTPISWEQVKREAREDSVIDVGFHPEARADFFAALAWYRSRSLKVAARFEAEVERVLGEIASHPESWPTLDDERRFVVLRRFPYSVIYQIQEGEP